MCVTMLSPVEDLSLSCVSFCCRRLIIMSVLCGAGQTKITAQFFAFAPSKVSHIKVCLCVLYLFVQHLKRSTERRPEKYKKRLVFFWRVTSNEKPSPTTQWYDGPNYLSIRSFTILQACYSRLHNMKSFYGLDIYMHGGEDLKLCGLFFTDFDQI